MPMKAVVYHGPGDIRVENLPAPDCGDDEALVDVDACAVCGTDLKTFHHGNPRIAPPLTMGHEFTGRVSRVGRIKQDRHKVQPSRRRRRHSVRLNEGVGAPGSGSDHGPRGG